MSWAYFDVILQSLILSCKTELGMFSALPNPAVIKTKLESCMKRVDYTDAFETLSSLMGKGNLGSVLDVK